MVMSGKSGGLVEIDDSGRLVRSVSNADPAFPDEGLLPYSLAILPARSTGSSLPIRRWATTIS